MNSNYKGKRLTAVQRVFLAHLREHPEGIQPFKRGYTYYYFGSEMQHNLTERTVRSLEAQNLIDVHWSFGWWSEWLVIRPK